MYAETTLANDTINSNKSSLFTRLRQAWEFNWALTLTGLLHFLLIPALIVAMVVDPRTITGAPAWIKPLKFAISGGIYGLTFIWLLTYVQRRRRWVNIAATVTGVALLVETALITIQVLRDTTSHYNMATAFDATVFGIMGGFVTALAFMNLLVLIWLVFQRMPDQVFAWGLRFGVLVTFVGMMTGFLMTTQMSPAQEAAVAAGEGLTAMGAHSVGVEDGGPGLPFLGWSTKGGDLRVPHFFGLHAMQILPLLGWLLTRPAMRRQLTGRQRLSLVWIGGLGYLSLVVLLTWQALRGQPVIAPDATTLSAYAMLAIAMLASTLGVLGGGNARTAPQPVLEPTH